MKNILKKISLSVKVLIIISIIALFVALYILNVNNVGNYARNINKNKENIEETSIECGYIIKNEKLFVSVHDHILYEVPIELSQIQGIDSSTGKIDENLYQISEDKIVFIYKENQEFKIITSDDSGKSWKKTNLLTDKSRLSVPMYIHFINKTDAKLIVCEDSAMQKVDAKILETTDAGGSWIEKKSGENGFANINLNSKFVFFDLNLGFISSPANGSEEANLYITKDGGDSFSIVELPEQSLIPINNNVYLNWSKIYDFPGVPKLEDGKLLLTVSQGSDGDYLGGKICAKYSSNDMGESWEFIEEYIPNEE